MISHDPRHYHRVLRDPVHGYITIYEELVPLVNSHYVQRLRRITQNSMAVAAYPSLNGSRFEHALGTMHLCALAWRVAYTNAWHHADSDAPPTSCQQDFADLIWRSMQDNRQFIEDTDPFLDEVLTDCGGDRTQWYSRVEHLMSLAIGAVGLLHDVGHPPFSHVLEAPFANHRDRIFGESIPDFSDEWKHFAANNPTGQFHEYAGSKILESILADSSVSARLPTYLVRSIFNARGDQPVDGLTWAWCAHQIIDGQIDMDRLDYIVRDALRAGSEFHAVDVHRLVGNMELHAVADADTGAVSWHVGVGVRALSAVEGLLSQREKSYRWLIFHNSALAADEAMRRSVSLIFDRADEFQELFTLSDLDYISRWSATGGGLPHSYTVDDMAIMALIRAVRQHLSTTSPDASENRKLLAYLRLADELFSSYVPAWRNYAEFLRALNRLITDVPALGDLLGSGARLQAQTYNDILRHLRDDVCGGSAVAVERYLERTLNAEDSTIKGVAGVWLISQKYNFNPINNSLDIWKGTETVKMSEISSVHVGLDDARESRPLLWAQFVPLDATDNPQGTERRDFRHEVQRRLLLRTLISTGHLTAADLQPPQAHTSQTTDQP